MNYADMILYNGNILSIDIHGYHRRFEAMAVAGEKIASIGMFSEMEDIISNNTQLIDLEGRCVLPGLSDSHLHASMTAEMVFDFSLHDKDLAPDKNREYYIKKYQEKIKRCREQNPEARILRGVGWNPVLFIADKEGQPTASDIDVVCEDIPVMLRSFDHHSLWVNSKALEIAGITRDTPDPRNGVIIRNDKEEPTGIFQETTAMDLLIRNLPGADYTVDEYMKGIEFYQNKFGNKYGETLIFDAYCSENAVRAYQELDKKDKLTMRVRTAYYADPSLPIDQFDKIIADKEQFCGGTNFDIKTVKFFIDGSGLTFYLNDPFEKKWLESIGLNEEYNGYPQWTLEELKAIFLKLDNEGFQIHAHCMADGAVKLALDAFEYVSQFNDIRENRHTIAHIMLSDEEDLKRIGELGVIAAVQPMWAVADGLSEESGKAMLGAERAKSFYPFGTIKKYGGRITCGTDFPVTLPPSPFIGIQTGMTRTVCFAHPEYDKYKGLSLGNYSEKLSFEDLLEGYSISSAYQCFLENVTGSLEVGKSADFIVLDGDITSVPVEEIGSLNVIEKYFKGKRVYTI